MSTLLLASLIFLVTHLGISSTPLRRLLVGLTGETPFLALYSLISLAAIGVMIDAYASIPHADFLWPPGYGTSAFARIMMPIAFVLLIGGLFIKNPTQVNMSKVVHEVQGDHLPGMLKITRHPVQWGIFTWAAAHLVANGDLPSIVFFGTFAVLSLVGTFAMDHKKRQSEDPAWQAFYATTSNIPLVAIITGKTRFYIQDMNWASVMMGLTLFATLYYFHGLITGVSLMGG